VSRQWWRDRFGFKSAVALTRWDRRLATAIGLAAAVITAGTLLGAAVMVYLLYSEGTTRRVGNPLETIFESRLMVGAARLAFLSIGLYVVLSVLMHIRRGQWLTGAGPFKVSESVRTLRDEAADRGADVRQALNENERLRTSLATTTQQVRLLETLLEKAQSELRKSASSD
jgi:hypothetical protein